MPEQEFEMYLSILSRLLRLSPAQKDAISDELRDHLERRLADLLQSGMPREEAITKAMDEFGDVTGLALDLTKVSRTPLRKVVMRSTIAASVAAVVIVGWITLFAPEHRLAAPPMVQAQQEQPGGKEGTETKRANQPAADNERGKPNTPSPLLALLGDEELFPEFLTRKIDVNFVDNPLTEVCEFLSHTHGVPALIHKSALQDNGIDLDMPITLQLTGLTFEEVLNHLTRPMGLAWEVDGGLVRITVRDHVRYQTRHFDLHSLTKRGHSMQNLVSFLRLAANDWENDGNGAGTTAVIGDSVVVRQSFHHQRRIARALAAIEQQEPMKVLDTCTGRDRLLQSLLRHPSEAEFVDAPLIEVLQFLSDKHSIPILLDTTRLEDEGIARDTPVTLTLKKPRLGRLLNLLLDELDLTYQLRDGVIRVTTVHAAEEVPAWIVYNVHDLADSGASLEELTQAIQNTTSGQWQDVDGEGGHLVWLEVGGCLLVKQTDKVQGEIQTLLEQLRQSAKGRTQEAGKRAAPRKMITKSYRLPREIASDLQATLPQLVAPASWREADGQTPTIALVASLPQLEHVDGSVSGGTHEIRILNPPKEPPKAAPNLAPKIDAKPESPANLAVQSVVVRPRSTLVIRQSPEVHREIKKFLTNLGLPVEAAGLDGDGSPGTGGAAFGAGFF
jgi:hypothetical protein